jgi:hypothetical protein
VPFSPIMRDIFSTMYDNFIGGTFHFWRKLIQSMFLEGRGYVMARF